jgi:hypothetical protein
MRSRCGWREVSQAYLGSLRAGMARADEAFSNVGRAGVYRVGEAGVPQV